MEVKLVSDNVMLAAMSIVELTPIKEIKDKQFEDPNLTKIRDNIVDKPDFQLVDKILHFKVRSHIAYEAARRLG